MERSKSASFSRQLLLHSCFHFWVVFILVWCVDFMSFTVSDSHFNVSQAESGVSTKQSLSAGNSEVVRGNSLECTLVGPLPGFIPGCGPHKDCIRLQDKEEAVNLCEDSSWCHGISMGSEHKYELRGVLGINPKGKIVHPSVTGEISFMKECYDSERSKPASFEYIYDDPDAEINGDWEKPCEENYNKVGFDIKGKSSIFVSVASYRDGVCQATIESAIARAKYPSRLVFGIVEQNYVGDEPCVPDCSQGSTNSQDLICRYLSQIRLFRVSSLHSQGPTWARHRSDRLYRGETYKLQIDAHMVFVRDWDEKIITQWLSTGNEYAILSSYPTEVAGSINGITGESLSHTVPVICGADPSRGDGLVRNKGAAEGPQRPVPMLQPFWAAGMSFSRGHLTLRVPYDCCTSMMFTGEEFSMLLRSWTHGYDVYAFNESLIFHYYPPSRLKQVPLFWENTKRMGGHKVRLKSTNRMRILLDLTGSTASKIKDYDDTDSEKYGLGKVRQVSTFLAIFGIGVNQTNPVIQDHCGKIMSGKVHSYLTQYLERNTGIDYSKVPLNAMDLID
mmetsp:Transcript_10231/g.13313  ORF Transcript_10231/g.13313 Transcript_10231/m.13313 type:complete len:561 (-) Transcript_10231:1558-3240(-)